MKSGSLLSDHLPRWETAVTVTALAIRLGARLDYLITTVAVGVT